MKSISQGPTVFIVDDDDAVRDSLALLLGLRGLVTRSFARGEEFLSAIDSNASGCVLLDLRLPGIDGLAVQKELIARGMRLPIIVLTAHGDAANARASLKSGAFDFLEKPIDDGALQSIIEEALARDHRTRDQADRRAEWQHRLTKLTAREREVLELVVHGRHNREIAATLGISPRTVEVYKARLMDKLQVDRLPDLIRIALDFELSSGQEAS